MFTVLSRWAANLQIAYDRHRAADVLSKLSDRQLLDIGLERYAIEDHVNQGLPWQYSAPDAGHPVGPSLQGCG